MSHHGCVFAQEAYPTSGPQTGIHQQIHLCQIIISEVTKLCAKTIHCVILVPSVLLDGSQQSLLNYLMKARSNLNNWRYGLIESGLMVKGMFFLIATG